MFSCKNNERCLKSSSSSLHIQLSCDKFSFKAMLCKKSFEIQFSGTEETFLSPCTINVCLILHVSLPVLASACCVPALPFGMSNMPPFTRILWNENTSHCSNAVWRDCVLLPVSQHVFDCTVQIRAQISLLRPSCAQDEGHMTFCPHFLCCSVLLFFSFFIFPDFPHCSLSLSIAQLASTFPTVCFRAAPSMKSFPLSTEADTCWTLPQRQKLRLQWGPIPLAEAPLRSATGNELSAPPLTPLTT